MRSFVIPLMASVAIAAAASGATAAPNVVVSIKPVHSLVAAIMRGVGEPQLIVDGAASPHTYNLRPSNARTLEKADLVFWVGPGLEAFLQKPLEALTSKATVVELEDAKGLEKLPFREGGPFEAHDDGEEAHGEHAGHSTAKTLMLMIMRTMTATMNTARTTLICGSIRPMPRPWPRR